MNYRVTLTREEIDNLLLALSNAACDAEMEDGDIGFAAELDALASNIRDQVYEYTDGSYTSEAAWDRLALQQAADRDHEL